MNNIIPQITDPLGLNWRQPNKDNILIDDSHAAMYKQDFDQLADYSLSQPSGVYVGKMWKASYYNDNVKAWYLCWYGSHPEPGYCSNNYRQILIVD